MAVGSAAPEAEPLAERLAPIRVAHLLDGRHFGGAEQMVLRLAEASPSVRVEASVYCLAEGRTSRSLRERGLNVEVFPCAGRFDFRPLGPLGRSLQAHRVELLQAHSSRTHLWARLLSRRLGLPNITTIQSPIALDENRGFGRHRLRAWVERLGRPWTERLCPVSEAEAERLIDREAAPPAKVRCIPNAVAAIPRDQLRTLQDRGPLAGWLAERGWPPATFVLVMIAALRPRKGAEVLLRALGRRVAEGGEGLLIVIGDGEFTGRRRYLESLRRLAGELGLAGRAHFTGFDPDPWRLAAGADAVVLPSLFGEGLPLTLIEAMNHARPILASDVPGNRECVEHGRTGWLHGPGQAAQLAAQIAEAARDRPRLTEFGRAGRGLFERKFQLAVVLPRWRALYEELLAERRGPRPTPR